MAEQEKESIVEIEIEEEIADEFQCCVCLDLLYKPVVIGCGHIACFWCVYRAMNFHKESNCPICRHPYRHFPYICRLMHFLLLKLYPVAYERREKQVTEEEKADGHESPQFDIPATSSAKAVRSAVKSLSEEEEASIDRVTKQKTITRDKPADGVPDGGKKQILLADVFCPICKQLLCRPVVLNCGHVYCETCIINPANKTCSCPDCQVAHPNGFPKVCLILQHLLKEYFPEEYAQREESLPTTSDSQSSLRAEDSNAQSSCLRDQDYLAWLSGHGPKFHAGVGCDSCGMCPIIGERYRCKDCKEAIGFDLCEGCYNSSSKLPGRFNQQHKADHTFEKLEPVLPRMRILRFVSENSRENGSPGAESRIILEPYLSDGSSEYQSDEASGDGEHAPEN